MGVPPDHWLFGLVVAHFDQAFGQALPEPQEETHAA
jgi:hypothetical protein